MSDSEAPARARILAAAAAVFAEQGYAKAGVKEICARAQVTTGALYHHFGGKPALYHEVLALSGSRLRAVMAEAADQAPPGARAVRAALLAAWDLVQADRSARLFLVQPAQAGDTATVDFLRGLWPWAPSAVAPVLLAAWRGALQEAMTDPEGDARLVLDGILRGLAGDIA